MGDDDGAAHVRNNLGVIHKILCEWDNATANFLQALEYHKKSGHFGETFGPLLNLGIVSQKSGDWKQAADYKLSDFVFDGSMEGDFDKAYGPFAEFAKGLTAAGVLSRTPSLHLTLGGELDRS